MKAVLFKGDSNRKFNRKENKGLKNLKKLTRSMKEVLSRKGYNPDEYGLVRGTNDVFVVQHRETGKQLFIEF